MRWPTHKTLAAGALLVVVLALAGCGKSVGEVSGKVTYKNKPVPYGTVIVQASDGLVYDGAIQADGSYSIKKVPVGPAKVVVTSIDPKAVEETNRLAGRVAAGADGKGKRPEVDADPARWSNIPMHYGDFSKSDLGLDVKPGGNRYDLNLK